ncbi:hypothetical protein LZD76_05280 [Lactobacillus mulieris]|uniref:Uncharacterized protein n=1 Tax=Lactobacillus mulieris TaxID=2508708 RepID=A0AAP3GYL2_9LACO|nr:hypothetical protein [Lactobacillus mulieris]MCF1783859.1 hypothetical protein [Lactobacillus mulieris]MCW8104721.1 hypothetical protein [Lactobacillus mulieris]MCZ3845278.1 hypothetical protein [Lactobacillus mulieris]MCZ3877018.1 hypothetical protein [Lactobacillus mulieris]MCZ3900481.1 hypothetical protein [Lactobacillus mulieris]
MLSEKIKIYRISKKLTQKEATEGFNKFLESKKYLDKKGNILKPISFKTWARWENNNKVPSKFFKALGGFCGLSDEECVNTGYSFSYLWNILEDEYIKSLDRKEKIDYIISSMLNPDIRKEFELALKKFGKENEKSDFIEFVNDQLPLSIEEQVEKGKVSPASAYLNIDFFETVDEYINTVRPRLYCNKKQVRSPMVRMANGLSNAENFSALPQEMKVGNFIGAYYGKTRFLNGVLVTRDFEAYLSFIFKDASFKRLLNTAEKYSNDEIIHLATLAITYRTSAILKNASKLEPYRDDEGALTDDWGQLTIDY